MNVSLRYRALVMVIGIGVFWASGYVASVVLPLTPDRPSVMCTDTSSRTCSTAFTLVIIAAVGFWTAVIAGATLLAGLIQLQVQSRQKKKGSENGA